MATVKAIAKRQAARAAHQAYLQAYELRACLGCGSRPASFGLPDGWRCRACWSATPHGQTTMLERLAEIRDQVDETVRNDDNHAPTE